MENTKPIIDFEKKTKSKVIFYCLFLIIIGPIFGYFFIYQKIEVMKAGLEIEYTHKAIALLSTSLSMGLYFLFLRINNDVDFKNLSIKEKKIFIGAMVFMTISVIATIVWFNTQIQNMVMNNKVFIIINVFA